MKPMISNKFKLTLITAAILSSGTASAALYQVVEVEPSTTFDYQSSFGVAIQPGTATGGSEAALGCFDSDATNCTADDFTLAGETRLSNASAGEAVDGLSYREEVPFGMDNRFLYIQDRDDFENYCDNELRFAICESWASVRWNQWYNELSGNTTPNSIAFTGSSTTGTPVDETQNVVVNSLTDTGEPVGIASTPGNVTEYRRNSVIGFVGGTEYSDGLQTRVWKTDGTYTVGSIATSATNDEGTYYSSKAALWNGTTAVQLNWGEQVDGAEVDNYLAQGSLRDFVVSGSTLYAVGYNTYDVDSNDNLLNATVFSVNTANVSDSASWSSSSVSGATVRKNNLRSGDYIYSNTILTGVNSNLVAIGESKRSVTGDNGLTGSRVFVVDDVTSPSASYLSGDIFFNGAGGKAGGINNYNEIVGQVDAENVREANGKPRRKRAFIYPYNGTGTVEERRALFNDQGWWLDNLTNGGTYSSDNNQYRIIDASDINDAGVIAATAIKCDGGYSTTAYNASCDGTETTVAVKLMPIPGATSADISARGTDEMTTERSGGSFGLWMLAVLGLLGFRRK
ncbi:DUF3466 family protein [Vibrio sp. ABG19]|uniref:DUF3466 family protein n=1 Tax=Vibrio sp. ABG19 TaxID=2817385 RepID=UPI00249DB8DD|nr:DUF3466 family protein [Vibrio sp. ABG19]WGY46941.1 DUF3466 family protein [Vibrio sp. ABG19]